MRGTPQSSGAALFCRSMCARTAHSGISNMGSGDGPSRRVRLENAQEHAQRPTSRPVPQTPPCSVTAGARPGREDDNFNKRSIHLEITKSKTHRGTIAGHARDALTALCGLVCAHRRRVRGCLERKCVVCCVPMCDGHAIWFVDVRSRSVLHMCTMDIAGRAPW